ncbi:regulatory inactivation of DnaA Hda protein [Alphaproteobacteria bacterium]|nr:regulatory inactivation of DnaA Hda protein [Alphaproteobacteria bacterium]GHS98332.1 regulatory inactivation of DnaA Hda protein [Alphaproteobacteria bacterium]
MPQRLLPLPSQEDYSLHKWVVSACNEVASRWVLRGPAEDNPRMACFCGAPQSGKTHLAHIFAHSYQGLFVAQPPDESPRFFFEKYHTFSVFAFDDIQNFMERWLFEAFNMLREGPVSVLFVSAFPPSSDIWLLKDWASRLRSLPFLPLENPDDELLAKVMKKRLEDCGVRIETDALRSLQQHIPRTFSAIQKWTRILDEASLRFCRPITRAFIRELVAEVASDSDAEFPLDFDNVAD